MCVDVCERRVCVAAIGGGTNKQEICPADEKHKRWADMVKKEIKPPSIGGGLDIAGGLDTNGNETWKGLTVMEAEQINCQSDSQGDLFGDGDLVNTWGDNGEHYQQLKEQDAP